MNEFCRKIIALSMLPGLGPRKIMARVKEGIKDDEIEPVMTSPDFAEELEYLEKEGIKPVSCLDEDYPEALKNIYDPPPILFYKGELCPRDTNAVAIVGSRRCTPYGLQAAERIAFDLAERGVVVVSGMASGIDTAAHRGALRAKGRTVAVMGSGFRHIYPPQAVKLAFRIMGSGAVLTEYLSGIEPMKGNFPRRNRIISGLVKGVVAVEAAARSGALITVDYALEQGKEVFAVPGRIDSYSSVGTNKLIQDGAKLVTGVDDVLEELDICPEKKEKAIAEEMPVEEHSEILEAIGKGRPGAC